VLLLRRGQQKDNKKLFSLNLFNRLPGKEIIKEDDVAS
jgi:hypothetical protein